MGAAETRGRDVGGPLIRATALLAVLLIAGIVALTTVLTDLPYRRAERYYQAGDFEKASIECERALKLNPRHAPAKALFMEIQFILGQGWPRDTTVDYEKYMGDWSARGILRDMDQALARAEETGDEREWRKILEYAKWLPDSPEVRERRDQARAYLECVSGPAASER